MTSMNCEDVRYFSVKEPLDYDQRFPFFREPKEQGCLSLGNDREFYNDARELKYLCMPKSEIHFNLNVGYNDMIIQYHTDEKLDNLLRWILVNKHKFSINTESVESLNTDFVCYRGLLTVILCTPYEQREDWLICATKFKGTIYLCAFPTQQYLQRKENETERDRIMTAWGHKFETYMVTNRENGSPDAKSPVNTNKEYCVIVRSRLKNHSLVYGAEVDCVEQCSYEGSKPYVELKTSRNITSDRQHRNFCRFKLLKWWVQSFLIGIPKIICGFRDDDGFVGHLETFVVQDIPKLSQIFMYEKKHSNMLQVLVCFFSCGKLNQRC
ncbi:decapping and exoribonuclease protein-like isoform X2 [Centruroides vittatus]|uniref:decapping and exoribonuclease protein-like isoform X2 n=1 Tax=Centruroides vittatus TaxID=120091 RepID=UPI0035107D5A